MFLCFLCLKRYVYDHIVLGLSQYNNKCGSIDYEFQNGDLFISGFGPPGCVFSNNNNLIHLEFGPTISFLLKEMFDSCTNLVSVKLPDIQVIPKKCFFNCTKLEKIEFSRVLRTIEEHAFAYCGLKHILFQSIVNIDIFAFFECNQINTLELNFKAKDLHLINFPNVTTLLFRCKPFNIIGLQKIENLIIDYDEFNEESEFDAKRIIFTQTFEEISGITKSNRLSYVSFPKGLKRINTHFSQTFENDTVELPSTLEFIQAEFLENCPTISTIIIKDYCSMFKLSISNTILFSQIKYVIFEDVNIYLSPSSFAYSYIETFTFKQNTDFIPERCFFSCHFLRSFIITSNVQSIGSLAFGNCSALTQITFPSTINSIFDSVFSGCISLSDIIIPNNITIISPKLFEYCQNLKSISIPDKVTRICYRAFYECTSLSSISCPDSILTIEKQSFFNCASLQKFDASSHIEFIGTEAFSKCSKLSLFTFSGSKEPIFGPDVFKKCKNLDKIQVSSEYESTTFLKKNVTKY